LLLLLLLRVFKHKIGGRIVSSAALPLLPLLPLLPCLPFGGASGLSELASRMLHISSTLLSVLLRGGGMAQRSRPAGPALDRPNSPNPNLCICNFQKSAEVWPGLS
jgi:hypothetical protein